MRVMVIVKANDDSEGGVMPDEKILTDMGKFNEELVKAGVMLAGEGLHPTSQGKRVKFDGAKRTVTDGPFAETKELIAGFWLWQVKSMEDAIEWLKRAPFDGGGAEFTPELREQEERLRQQIEKQTS
ncbi:MAG: dehydrogenase [Acidobacteria bacterium]|nr:MAG: dehydrogenase [Acidobacteriota bacterium]